MQKGAILWMCVNTFVPHCSCGVYHYLEDVVSKQLI